MVTSIASKKKITLTEISSMIRRLTKGSLAECFFKILSEKLAVIYDWELRVLWVIDRDEKDDNASKFPMSEDEFIQLTGAEVTDRSDVVVFLLKSDIEVDVRNYKLSFKTAEQFEKFLEDTRLIATSRTG